MAAKKKVPSSRREVIKNAILATTLGIVAYGFFIFGTMQGLDTQRSLSMHNAQERFRQDKLVLLYGTTKAAAAGVKQDSAELPNYYARVLSPDLNARFKKDGPAVLLCSSRLPDLINVRPLGGNDNFMVDESFFNGTGQEATMMHPIVEFTPSEGYDSTKGMLDTQEKVSKITCS